MAAKKYSARQLTKFLRELAEEMHTMGDAGEMVTKAEALARLLWDKALGYKHRDPKTGETKWYKPESWAIQLIYERMEGKAPVTMEPETSRITAAQKIGDLARNRLNSEAELAVALPGDSGPVDGPNNGSEGSEESGPESSLAG